MSYGGICENALSRSTWAAAFLVISRFWREFPFKQVGGEAFATSPPTRTKQV